MNTQFEFKINVELKPHQIKSIIDLEQRELEHSFSCNEGDVLGINPHFALQRLTRSSPEESDNPFITKLNINTTISIFGDIPGYGKTYSMVSLIARNRMPWNLDEPFEQNHIVNLHTNYLFSFKETTYLKKLDCTLLLASTSILKQWEESFDRSKNIVYCTVSNKKQLEELEDPDEYHVVLCSDKTYNSVVSKFSDYAWKRFVFDEAASIYVSKMRYVNAGFTWFITATFPTLSSKKIGRGEHYMNRIFNGMTPFMFDALVVKNEDDYVRSSFSLSPPIFEIHECISSNTINAVLKHVPTQVNVMLRAGNVAGAIAALGCKESNRSIIDIVVDKKQEKLQLALDSLEKWKKHLPSEKRKEGIEKWTKKIEDIKKEIKILTERISNVIDDVCSICQENIKNPILLTCCQNMFCVSCIMQWYEKQNLPLVSKEYNGKAHDTCKQTQRWRRRRL